MKQKIFLIICICIIVALIFGVYRILFQPFNVDFAEKITLKYQYKEKNIDIQITDINDFNALVSICKGIAMIDSPSCGFGTAELIFEGERRIISIFPACDGCDLMEINNSGKFFKIGKENRKRLEDILKKYGADFPCI